MSADKGNHGGAQRYGVLVALTGHVARFARRATVSKARAATPPRTLREPAGNEISATTLLLTVR
jgi:hypothetical protein